MGLKRILFVAIFLLIGSMAGAIPPENADPAIQYVLRLDSVQSVDLQNNVNWYVETIDFQGKKLNFRYYEWDSSKPVVAALKSIHLTAKIRIADNLLNTIMYLHFSVNGSVRFTENNHPVFSTGIFFHDSDGGSRRRKKDDFVPIILKDSLSSFDVIFLPDASNQLPETACEIGTRAWGERNIAQRESSRIWSYSMAFYMLAIGVIFLIFYLFYKGNRDNLHFSLFCIGSVCALLWMIGRAYFFTDDTYRIIIAYLIALSLEFLAIFLTSILRRKKRNSAFLKGILYVGMLVFVLAIYFNTKLFPRVNESIVRKIEFVLMVALIAYLAYLLGLFNYLFVKGFKQKHWEAKVIAYTCFFTSCITFFIPLILENIPALAILQRHPALFEKLGYLSSIGFYIYPLTVAIVLGRRNGLNQQQLQAQIESIEQLSAENLKKEKEKQLLLEEQNEKLEQKVNDRTAELQQKNKEITDNIHYAQRIQSAILPDLNLIYRSLRQAFVLYLPKDIVSGDFYAFAETEDKIIIIAGDCTGHGVSGAFMSMIGSSLLNQIINEKKILEPAEILNQLNAKVIEALRQGESDSNDGMDISICTIEKTFRKLEFAGANRPLWLIRGSELEIIKPDKFPIGGLQAARDRRFTNHHIEIKPDDTVYLFTDGYADQFGGDKGKKMMTAKFKESLLSIQHLDMSGQYSHLNERFKQWKGANEQVDDVLVIGIRI